MQSVSFTLCFLQFTHSSPPFCSCLIIVLVCNCLPPPQVLVQLVAGLHVLQIQSTIINCECNIDIDQSRCKIGLVSQLSFVFRLLFANFTSSLLVVNSTLLVYAGAALLGGAAILLALYYLANVSQSSSGYGYQYSQYSRGFRSEDAGNEEG